MRLIDVDVLHEALEQSFITNEQEELALENILNLQPTVDPVKRGHWIDHPLPPTTYKDYRCSECECYFDYDSHYCPNCGAYMDHELYGLSGTSYIDEDFEYVDGQGCLCWDDCIGCTYDKCTRNQKRNRDDDRGVKYAESLHKLDSF